MGISPSVKSEKAQLHPFPAGVLLSWPERRALWSKRAFHFPYHSGFSTPPFPCLCPSSFNSCCFSFFISYPFLPPTYSASLMYLSPICIPCSISISQLPSDFNLLLIPDSFLPFLGTKDLNYMPRESKYLIILQNHIVLDGYWQKTQSSNALLFQLEYFFPLDIFYIFGYIYGWR